MKTQTEDQETAGGIAAKLWLSYLLTTEKPDITITEANAAYKKYKDGLIESGIRPTLAGYRFNADCGRVDCE